MPRSRGDRRSRHNTNRPSFAVDNEYNPDRDHQYFQVSVNVLEARKLVWSNPHSANSYVIVVLGKKRHRTSIRRNMEEPHYREYFVFEMYSSIRDIQCGSLWLAVMEPRFCAPPRLLGEATIDLGSIWVQPQHLVYHKWAQLTLPRDPSIGPVGFLKVDISIIFRGEVQIMPAMVTEEKVEDNLLLPSGSEQQRANYLITIYAAFGLPTGDRRHSKPPSTFVRTTFCGLTAKTAIQPRNYHPKYCEQVSIVEMFPNMNQVLRLEVCHADGCFNKILADTEVGLGQVSHDGENGFLPTFGPSLLHMYGSPSSSSAGTYNEDGPFHRGALLVSLKTIVPYYQQGVRTINIEPVSPIQMDSLWVHEDFCIFSPILEISMVDRRFAGTHCGIAITIADIPCDKRPDEDFLNLMTCIKAHKLHYTGAFEVIKTRPAYGIIGLQNSFPVLQLATRLPDFRFRIFRNNMAHGIVAELESALNDVERRLKAYEYATPSELMDELNKTLDDAAGNILKYLDIIQYSSREETVPHHSTELDQKQLALQKEEIEKIYEQMSRKFKGESSSNIFETANSTRDILAGTRKGVKLLIAETKDMTHNLRNILHKTPDGWPDIVVWFLSGGSRVAYGKISPADIIYSVIPEQCGKNCGRIQTIYMKPLKCSKHTTNCFCISAKVELVFWMGLFRQTSAFEACLPYGYYIRYNDHDMKLKSKMLVLEYRAFIYRAKLTITDENSCNLYSFVRINLLNAVKDTKVKPRTNAPLWNQVLKLQRVVFMTVDRVRTNPPTALVEIYDDDLKGKIDLVGRCQITPIFDDNPEFENAPKLQWFDIHKGIEHTGQILMSMQLFQVPEKLMKNTVYSPIEETFYETGTHRESDTATDEAEALPSSLVPTSTCYKVDIYWWGLRDVNITRKPCVALEIDDMVMKSSVITDKKSNSNFSNGKSSQIFEAPLTEMYSPSLSIKLYDSSTFGRTMFLGTNVVKNPNKYIVNWLPKTEREASLLSASIMSSAFYKVSDATYLKKNSLNTDTNERRTSNLSLKSILAGSTVKQSKWRRLFSRKEPDEEEYTLLPIYVEEIETVTLNGKSSKSNESEWWTRYFYSQKGNDSDDAEEHKVLDKITIYDSELELQPEFAKFRDWCSTMKLYNGAKTGIPEKDQQLLCGYLKAGIAIYKWPPPANTVAVSFPGVELDNGYFFNHPNNTPGKYLVRVYVVKALNLAAKYFTGKSDPYIVISCGKKHFGDRNNYIKDSVDPIFGNMYEFRCNLPEDYKLSLSVYDYDPIPPDELIGSTTIDLENRIYTKHRAQIGLPTQYNRTGPMKWRDLAKPSAILEELCAKNYLPPPVFPDSSSVLVNGIEYRDDGKDTTNISAVDRKENICLNLLHNWHTFPICGYHLVPEHVETRTLYNPDKPGYEQGKLQMWLDIFPMDIVANCPPPPVDIKCQPPQEYELRVIVWDVEHIVLDNLKGTGKLWKTADLYVKAWIGKTECAQQTDAHYNSCDGEAHFNYRMIFPILYNHARKRMIVKEVQPFIEHEEYVQPVLVVQLLENDRDEMLGSLALNLNRFPLGTKFARQCALDVLKKCRKINMFEWNSVRSWWPLKIVDTSTGKDNFAVSKVKIVTTTSDTASRGTAFWNQQLVCGDRLLFTFSQPLLTSSESLVLWNNEVILVYYMQVFITRMLCGLPSGIQYYLSVTIKQVINMNGAIDLEIILLREDEARARPAGLGRDPPCPIGMPNRQNQCDRSWSCCKVTKVICYDSETLLIYVVVLGITVSFILYVMYLGVPVTWGTVEPKRKNVEGIIRTLYPVRI